MSEPAREENAFGAFFAALTGRWNAATIDSVARTLENRDAEEASATSAIFQTIDAKATGLLTHVSMMIAGLGICAPLVAQHPIEEAIVIAEIAVYLVIAVGCLRCLSVVRSLRDRRTDTSIDLHVQRELIIRHELYRICNKASIYFTLVVFISLPLMLWWRPQ